MTEGPWYAAKKVPTVHHTMGGLRINERAQVLNNKGEVIPGLYAAGEVTGGIHGSNRLGGNAIADVMVFGRTAGTNAVLLKKCRDTLLNTGSCVAQEPVSFRDNAKRLTMRKRRSHHVTTDGM